MEDRLWGLKDVADYLGISKKVAERYAKDPSFPNAIRLPNGQGGFSHPRWKASQVVGWVDGYQTGCTQFVPN